MIDLNFGLWHSGAKLSYLRYLTFKTLRHFHPHSRIQLFTNNKSDNSIGGIQEHDFKSPKTITIDYMDKLSDLGIEIVKTNSYSKYSPNHQSDFFRWSFLKNNGGFYLDTDQIVLKSLKDLPLKKYDFIYCSYDIKSIYVPDGRFCPVGVLGASNKSITVLNILSQLPKYYNKDNYNCIGPLMFRDMEKKINMKESFNAPSNYFYPVPICDQIERVYKGNYKIEKESYLLHWYGGYSRSQIFNKLYTEELSKVSNDTISRFLREKKII